MSDNDNAVLPMNVMTAIRERRCVRAFLNKPVSSDILTTILDTAKWAPSGVNTQPWKVAILGPIVRKKISDAIIDARHHNVPENPDYQYYPEQWIEPYKSRRKACGLALYGALNIPIQDVERRKIQWYKNYSFFNAPAAFIFYLESVLCKGSWMDLAMFIQNVMLAARGCGLETCPQAALAEYPNIIRQALSLPSHYHIACGMALGYADWSDPVNGYRTTREPIEQFTQWYE